MRLSKLTILAAIDRAFQEPSSQDLHSKYDHVRNNALATIRARLIFEITRLTGVDR